MSLTYLQKQFSISVVSDLKLSPRNTINRRHMFSFIPKLLPIQIRKCQSRYDIKQLFFFKNSCFNDKYYDKDLLYVLNVTQICLVKYDLHCDRKNLWLFKSRYDTVLMPSTSNKSLIFLFSILPASRVSTNYHVIEQKKTNNFCEHLNHKYHMFVSSF